LPNSETTFALFGLCHKTIDSRLGLVMGCRCRSLS